jgi:hypothetical protein
VPAVFIAEGDMRQWYLCGGGGLTAAIASLTVAWGQVQPSTAVEAAEKLAGSSAQTWVYERLVTTMGTDGPRCSGNAKLYRFASDKSLTKTECVAGKQVKTVHTWAVDRRSPLDMVLTIDGRDDYKLLFRDAGDRHYMVLRKDEASKTAAVQDLEFQLGGD